MQTPHSRLARWSGPAAIALTGATMLWLSWGQWPDVLVDFGRELYVPWRLAEGQVLYRDIAYFNGPLSPYLNALWFRLFGVGLRTLALCNLSILAGVVALVYRLLLDISDRFAATVGGLVLLAVFAFSQITRVANYNWVCPYSHEVTHGVALALLALFFLSLYQKHRGAWAIAAAGLALGLTFLTKAEVFLAAALGLSTGLGLMLWAERPGRKRLVTILALFAGGLVLPPLVAFALLATAMPGGQALRAALGTWPHVLGSRIGGEVFYRGHMGTLDALASAKRILAGLVWYAVVVGGGSGFAVALGRRQIARRWVAVAALVVLAPLFHRFAWFWRDAARPLPMVLVVVGCWLAATFARRPAAEVRRDVALRLSITVFAFVLLWKIVLNVRFHHYGFALAMPGAMVLAAAGLGWVPAWLDRRGAYGHGLRAVVLAGLAAIAYAHVGTSLDRFGSKPFRVGRGADALMAGPRGRYVNAALAEIERRVGKAQTLAVLPEGVMLNYLARRENPTPFINLMPPEVILFGEAEMLAAFRAHPPDFVALVHKSTLEYGLDFFGRGYAQQLYAWVQANYRPVWQVGATPLRTHEFGIQLLERVKKAEE